MGVKVDGVTACKALRKAGIRPLRRVGELALAQGSVPGRDDRS